MHGDVEGFLEIRQVTRTAAWGQLLLQISGALAAHGIRPVLNQSHLFFMIGFPEDAQEQFQRSGVPGSLFLLRCGNDEQQTA